MIVLGVDPARHSGWCVLQRATAGRHAVRVDSGVLLLRPRAGVHAQIRALLSRLPRPDHAIIEAPVLVYERGRVRNQTGYRTHAGIMALWVDAIREVYDVAAEIVYPSQWQSRVLAGLPGTPKSRSMVAATQVCTRLDGTQYVPQSDDEADAVCIAYYGYVLHALTHRMRGDGRDGIRRALNTFYARHGGDPMTALMEDDDEQYD